jgi:diguanylate cyclase (GGDEF)-like protein
LKTLAPYLAIAINNAQKSKALKNEIKIRQKTERELKVLNSKLQKISEMDGLTNIPNRRCFDRNFDSIWKNALRRQEKVSLLLVDIDFFKEFNDYCGHLEGDKVLYKIAKTIEKSLKRSTDVVARYGGDEFVVLLPNTDRVGALTVAENIKEQAAALKIPHPQSKIYKVITLSIGVSTLRPTKEMKKNQLLEQADKALYQSKAQDRNRISIFS